MAIDMDFINKKLEENPVKTQEAEQKTAGKNSRNTRGKSSKKWTIEDQDAFVERNEIEAGPRQEAKDGGTAREITCPFCNNKASIHLSKDGVPGFHCFHDTNKCHEKHWSDYEKHYEPAIQRKPQYEATDDGMVWNYAKNGPMPLSNFTAEILADTTTDDGAEQTRSYELQTQLLGRQARFEIKASDFASCAWVDDRLGARACISVGQSIKSHLVNAIKACSDPEEQFHYAHTGWRKVDGAMVYLHAGEFLSQVSQVGQCVKSYLTQNAFFNEAAIRANVQAVKNDISQVSQVSQVNTHTRVKLNGTLKDYVLSADRRHVTDAIRASLRIMDLTTDTITAPLYASLWRSVMGDIDYGVHLAGESGMGKTELCVLIQQHFGTSWTNRHLPGNWESTDNSLEFLLFQAKDCVVVVDDFKPKGSKVDQERLHAKADRVFRQIGNGSARGRLSNNLEQRAERRPRGMLISTGEDVPKGQSLKARGVVLTMTESITTPGVPSQRLKDAQKDAYNGLYVQAMAAYIDWLTPRIETIQKELPMLIIQERDALSLNGHARSSTNTAQMLIGLKFFLQFACEVDAISVQEAQAYLSRCRKALIQVASIASHENTQDKPTEQWRRHIITAITSGSAHLLDPQGDCPGMEYGWVKSVRTIENNGITQEEETLRGGGTKIGWIDGDDIYLIPGAAYKAARAIGSANSDDITTTETTLRKFLVQDKLLASTHVNTKRNTITVRRTLQKLQQDVLHFKKDIFFPVAPVPNSLDSLDLPDLEPHETASQAASDTHASKSSKGDKSSSLNGSHLTNEHVGDVAGSNGVSKNSGESSYSEGYTGVVSDTSRLVRGQFVTTPDRRVGRVADVTEYTVVVDISGQRCTFSGIQMDMVQPYVHLA